MPEVSLIIAQILLSIVIVTFSALILRAILMMPTIVRNLEAQTELLAEIAKNQQALLNNKNDPKND